MMYFDPVTNQWYPTTSVPSGSITAFQSALVDPTNNAEVDLANEMIVVPGGVLMTTRLTVTVFADGSRDGGTRRAECVKAAQMLAAVGAQLTSTEALTGTIVDSNGVAAASYVYNPTAPS